MKISVGKIFERYIEAYGLEFGMNRDEMATFLMRRAVDDLIRSSALSETVKSMRLARKINRSNDEVTND